MTHQASESPHALFFQRNAIDSVNLGLTEEQRREPQAIIEAIQQYVESHVNETEECRNFRSRVQKQGELFDDFLISFREFIKTCNFCSEACTQKSIRRVSLRA